MQVVDARRLTGPNLQTMGPAAICELSFGPDDDVPKVELIWRESVERLLLALGLPERTLTARGFGRGAAWLIDAPIDELYATVSINEWACCVAIEALGGEPARPLEEMAETVRGELAEERDPGLLELQTEALRLAVPFLWDDDEVSLGYGKYSRTWDRSELPKASELSWSDFKTIPVVLITGTNGKTTTSRMLARIVKHAGMTPGATSTDGLYVDEQGVEYGDWTGPGAARAILRHKDVEVAILETARGGILRRGVGVTCVDAAVVTNISSDHLGEYGVVTLDGMARAKGVVYSVVSAAGRRVFNMDDVHVEELASHINSGGIFTSARGLSPKLRAHASEGGTLLYVDDGDVVLVRGDVRRRLLAVDEIPCTFGGAAIYNVSNAITAAALALSIDIPEDAIAAGLRSFGASWHDNPGRGQLTEVNGIKVMLDFGHNPDGVSALLNVVNELLAKGDERGRLSVCVGQAGDRSDEDIFDLARVITGGEPSQLYLRSMNAYLRGREEGEVPKLFREAFIKTGVQPDILTDVVDELDGLRRAMLWAKPGDLILHLVHLERDAVEAYLFDLGASI